MSKLAVTSGSTISVIFLVMNLEELAVQNRLTSSIFDLESGN